MRLALNNVTYDITGERILDQLSCRINTGITYIIGKNGSGKSTLLKLCATALQPTEGTIEYTELVENQQTILQRKRLTIEDIRRTIGYMPQEFTGYGELSIERYLRYMAAHKGIPRQYVKKIVREWLEKTNLYTIRRKALFTLSGGQLKKVGLIQALINQPSICILDEPFEGLDQMERYYFDRVLRRSAFHSIILISTNIVEEMQEGDVLYLDRGKIRLFTNLEKESRQQVKMWIE
ncbi:ATP-binding cassette domain-containing protein [Ornithinibacillus sp. 4-3]|uniref:ATP-binding cassette domain-containing protein n=1 Tax=Ornithinibacillus sp. 4-3 TaxID=3231488 RepID=A0AB39HNX6_9BACI